MNQQAIVTLVLVLAGMFVLSRIMRVAADTERFAVVDTGRFRGLKGPGILMKLDRARWHRVKLGDRGRMLAPGVARIGDGDLPVTAEGAVEPQRFVRVHGFEGEGTEARIVVALDPDQRQEVRCPKCGHVMEPE